jgi:hypothetical protein
MSKHAKTRARERYSLAVYDEDFQSIAEQVADGRAEKLKKISEVESVYRVNVQNRICIIVWHRKAKVCVTFLPPEWNKHLREQAEKYKIQRKYYRKGKICHRGEND